MSLPNDTAVDSRAASENTGQAGRVDDSIGALLIKAGKLKATDLERVLELQKKKGLRFGEAAMELRLVTDKDIQRALALQFRFPCFADPKAVNAKLLAATRPFDPSVEALRTVRAQLLLGWFASGNKMLAVGAPSEGEDADALVANLAVLFAQLGKKTLLVDANLKKPTIHTLFGVRSSSGLSELLSGRVANFAPVPVPPFQTLSLMPAGAVPPNPSELLFQPGMDFFLSEASEAFDVVLINTPTADVSTDFQIVAARAGGMLVSVRRNKTKVSRLAEMKDKVQSAGAELVGAVLAG